MGVLPLRQGEKETVDLLYSSEIDQNSQLENRNALIYPEMGLLSFWRFVKGQVRQHKFMELYSEFFNIENFRTSSLELYHHTTLLHYKFIGISRTLHYI